MLKYYYYTGTAGWCTLIQTTMASPLLLSLSCLSLKLIARAASWSATSHPVPLSLVSSSLIKSILTFT